MNDGRTGKAIKNSEYAIISKILETVLAFILRSVFIRCLSTVYLGLNGVFTNVLTVLSLMDLGLGSAIAFSLYKPLADNNRSKIVALMDLYRKLYRNIGIIICVAGFCLTPFLKYIITLPEEVPHIYIIYWLNICNTAITYFVAYKRTLLIADQRLYINYQNNIIFKFTRFFILSGILIFTHNFILYLALDIFNTFISSVVISLKVNKIYPYLKEYKGAFLEKEEKKNILKYMRAGILNKIGQTVVTSTDNIVISSFISTITVGLYSNYLMVLSGVETFVYTLFSNLTSSVGNLAAGEEKDIKKIKSIFNTLQTVNHMVSTVACVGLAALANCFIELWLGKDYLLPIITIYICIINLYITLNTNSISNFMGARGDMYYINRFRPIIEAVVNLSVSIILVKFTSLGLNGVFLGTLVSFLCGRIWMDAHVLYKYWFKENFFFYIIGYLKKLLFTVAVSALCIFICNLLRSLLGLNILTFILMTVVVLVITITSLYLVYRKTESMAYIKNLIVRKLKIGIK